MPGLVGVLALARLLLLAREQRPPTMWLLVLLVRAA
jgi:hypothetical protein